MHAVVEREGDHDHRSDGDWTIGRPFPEAHGPALEYEWQNTCQRDAEAHNNNAHRIKGWDPEHRKHSTLLLFTTEREMHTRFVAR
jgi:hypothetical protein